MGFISSAAGTLPLDLAVPCMLNYCGNRVDQQSAGEQSVTVWNSATTNSPLKIYVQRDAGRTNCRKTVLRGLVVTSSLFRPSVRRTAFDVRTGCSAERVSSIVGRGERIFCKPERSGEYVEIRPERIVSIGQPKHRCPAVAQRLRLD